MLVRATQILEVLSVIIFTKFSYYERPKVKSNDLYLLLIEVIYLEGTNLLSNVFDFSMGSYLILFAYLELCYERSIKNNIFRVIFCIVSISLLQLLLTMLCFFMDEIMGNDIVTVCISILCCILVFILGKCSLLYKISNYFLKNERMIKIIFAIIAAAVTYLLFLYKNDSFFRLTDFLFFGVWSVLICFLAVSWQKTRIENITKGKELEVRAIYEKRYQELLESVRKRQHDFDNQLSALSGQQVYANSAEELAEKQQEYSGHIRKENRYNKLIVKGAGAPILTGFLFNKCMEAERRGCTVSYEVSYGTMDCEIPMYQLIDIFGVLLDNAIEALEQSEGEKKLFFRILEFKDQIGCGIYNATPYMPAEKIHEMVKREVSTKGEGRGIGLPKVIELLNEKDVDLLITNKKMSGENYLAAEFQIKKL